MATQMAKSADKITTASTSLEAKNRADNEHRGIRTPEAAKPNADGSCMFTHIANLEMLAGRAFDASIETFEKAHTHAVSPSQAIAFKREAAAMAKSYASLLATIQRLRDAIAKADS